MLWGSMFWTNGDNDQAENTSDDQRMQGSIDKLREQFSEMRSSFNSLHQRLDQIDHREEYDVESISDRMEEHTNQMTDRLKEIQSAITSLHERQRAVETKIDDEYRPELRKEQDLIDTVLEVMRDIQDRLGTYGKLQQNVRKVEEQIKDMEETLAGKVGRREFEELSRQTREDIKHLKARLDMLD